MGSGRKSGSVVRDWILAHEKEYSHDTRGRFIEKAKKATGRGQDSVRRMLWSLGMSDGKSIRHEDRGAITKKANKKAKGGRKVDRVKSIKLDILADQEKLDPVKAIREVLDKIPRGEVSRYDDVRRATGLSVDRFKDAAVHESLDNNKARLPGQGTTNRVVFGHEEDIAIILKMDGVAQG
jgi:O6-methylguanine-DNA--protein-cysteine methyltransferase